jgi:hypothetical protein
MTQIVMPLMELSEQDVTGTPTSGNLYLVTVGRMCSQDRLTILFWPISSQCCQNVLERDGHQRCKTIA